LFVFFCAWLVAATVGSLWLLDYSTRPGAAEPSPPSWPDDTTLVRSVKRATLVTFVHPQCPCSRATLGELSRILVGAGDRVDAQVVVVRPSGMDDSLVHGFLWKEANSMPGVLVVEDPGGREARRFGARTSGHVVLYGPEGDLRFSGGITPGRDHFGDSVGRTAILAELSSNRSEQASAPVFGCGLFDQPPEGGDAVCSDLTLPDPIR